MALLPMNSDELDAAIAKGGTVLAYFWTDWHENCNISTPILEEVADKYGEEATVCAVNADADGFRAIELGVYSIPTAILFHGCEEIERIAGPQPVGLYNSLLESCLHPEDVNPYDLINSMGYQ